MGGVSYLEYLNDPRLVARFQRYFGVHAPTSSPDKSSSSSEHDNHQTSSQRVLRSAVRKISSGSNSDDTSSKRLLKSIPSGPDCDFEWDLSSNGKKSATTTTTLPPISSTSTSNVKNRGNANSHARNESSGSSGISSGVDEDEDKSTLSSKFNFDEVVTNKFWYYLFKFGTQLGDEVFYSCWFSFWFWNIDGAVGRRVVMMWGILMYIGQGLKDIIRWPRPMCPPVVRLEKKWEMEYGLPSTHAVVGAAVPFATIIFTSSRYQYPIELGVIGAVLWCTVVCMSRLYLGMHSVLDILAGLSLVITLFVPAIPLVDWLDSLILQNEFGGLGLFLMGVFLCFCTPGGDRWSPARSDTFVILGSCVGLIAGQWLNFQLSIIRGPPLDPPYQILWPSYSMLGLSLLRLILGLCIIVASRAIIKSILYTFFYKLLKITKRNDLNNASKPEIFAELSSKYLTYVFIGLHVTFVAPSVFRLMGIQRPTFHTEI